MGPCLPLFGGVQIVEPMLSAMFGDSEVLLLGVFKEFSGDFVPANVVVVGLDLMEVTF
jgi:hypothetical protein